MAAEWTSMYMVYQLDAWRDHDGGWYINDQFERGTLKIKLAKGESVNDKKILEAMRDFTVWSITGTGFPALTTTDRRRVYAEDLYATGDWWEVGRKKEHCPLFGLRFNGEMVNFVEGDSL